MCAANHAPERLASGLCAAAVGGNWTGNGAAVAVDAGDLSMFAGEVLSDFLPLNEQAKANNGKWAFAKAASVKWAKLKKGADLPEIYDAASGKGLVVDTSKGKTNLSGLKFTYAPKTGLFKGSFKIYAIQNGKLKKFTSKIVGLVVNGTGFGLTTIPGKATQQVQID